MQKALASGSEFCEGGIVDIATPAVFVFTKPASGGFSIWASSVPQLLENVVKAGLNRGHRASVPE